MNFEKSRQKWDAEAENMRRFLFRELDETGGVWEALILQNLNCIPDMKVLDVGCGTGVMALLSARIGCDVTAIDNSEAMLQQARLISEKLALSDRIDFRLQDAISSDFAENTFDAIVSRHAFWLFEKPETVYKEWKRILKPGGCVFNLDANWLFPLWGNKEREEFYADEENLIEKFGEFQDYYHDSEMMDELEKLPLAYTKRPEWDIEICKKIGFRKITTDTLSSEAYWNPFLARRYDTMPTFTIKARK